jgi:hypothetical protein
MFEIIANMVVKEARIGTPRGRLSAFQVSHKIHAGGECSFYYMQNPISA